MVENESAKKNISEAGDDHSVEYEKVLEEIGFGKTQWILLLISGLLTVTSISVQTSIGIIAIASQCEFDMSQAEKGVMMAACAAGLFLSTYIWGYFCDVVGRRLVLVSGTFATYTLLFVSVFVTNIWFFNIINLLVGISLGGVSAALYPYLSEFNTAKHRVVVINYSTMFVSVAVIYVPATAWLVQSFDWSMDFVLGITLRPWRLMIIFNLLPGLIGSLLLLKFPESPKLLLALNKQQEAMNAVNWICEFNKGRSLMSVVKIPNFKLRPEIISDDDVINNENKRCFLILIFKAIVPLFYRTNFLISAATVCLLFFSANGMQVWYPEIVNRVTEYASNKSATICESLDASFAKQAPNATDEISTVCVDVKISEKTYIDSIIFGCAFLLGFNIQGFLLNPVGRKNILLGSLSIGIASVLLLQFVTNSTAVLILFCLYILLPGLSISIMLGAVVGFVPTPLRGKAVSICLTLGRLGIVVAANLIGNILEPTCIGTFALFTVSLLVCAVLVSFLPF